MKNFRKACRGEKGFTLIELLVVIIILGVLAAVVTLAVTRFIGKGKLEAANAELVTVQAAIEAALADGNASEFTVASTGSPWDGGAGSPVTLSTDNVTVDEFLRTHQLKAHYTINTDGDITAATCNAVGEWGTSITFNATTVKWEKVP